MIPISRSDESSFLNNLFSKKAYNFTLQRLLTIPIKKDDPFKDFEHKKLWKLKGNKLLKNKSYKES